MAQRVRAADAAVKMRGKLVDRTQTVKKYGVSTFSETQMQGYYDSSLIPDDFFRAFNPVKPEKNRRLNPAYNTTYTLRFRQDAG